MLAIVDNTIPNEKSPFLKKLKGVLKRIGIPFQTYREVAPLLADADKISAVILSGSGRMVDADLRAEDVACALAALALDVPVLGICFGCQLLCWLSGARLVKLERPLCESLRVRNHEKNDVFFCMNYVVDVPPRCPMKPVMTCDGFVGPCAFEHKSRPWYGTLFHPEASGAFGEALLKKFWASRHDQRRGRSLL